MLRKWFLFVFGERVDREGVFDGGDLDPVSSLLMLLIIYYHCFIHSACSSKIRRNLFCIDQNAHIPQIRVRWMGFDWLTSHRDVPFKKGNLNPSVFEDAHRKRIGWR
mmetsp:Transcript_15358/g.19937  ORF Transcript_15358/g.19937 Transcript_15358/m.19937 type:complete len:107 (+) Transcript_15358:25-345(+)